MEPFRAVHPISELKPGDIGMSGIGAVAAANVVSDTRPLDESSIVVSMYARWTMPYPITGSPWSWERVIWWRIVGGEFEAIHFGRQE